MIHRSSLYFRNFIFGVEDSLVSTVGLLSGVAIGGITRDAILLTGVVLILVEALSMAAGSFLVESSVQEYTHEQKTTRDRPVSGGIVMFVSYAVAGFVPLSPYLFIDISLAIYVSAFASLIALFVLGIIGGSLSNGHLVRSGLRMFFIGGIAITAGILAGKLFAI